MPVKFPWEGASSETTSTTTEAPTKEERATDPNKEAYASTKGRHESAARNQVDYQKAKGATATPPSDPPTPREVKGTPTGNPTDTPPKPTHPFFKPLKDLFK